MGSTDKEFSPSLCFSGQKMGIPILRTRVQCPMQQCILPKHVLALTFFAISCIASLEGFLICALKDYKMP